MAFNVGYKQGRWEVFRNVCGPFRALRKSAEEAGHVFPSSPLDPSHCPCLYPTLKAMAFRGAAGVPSDTLGGVRDVAVAADSVWRVLAVAAAMAADSVALLVRRAAAVIAVSVMALPVFPLSAAVIASRPKPPVLPRARSLGAYPPGKVGSQGSPSSIFSQRVARFGKGISSSESHCCANQFYHQIWTQRVTKAGTWGLRWRSQGTYSSNSYHC